MTISEFVRQQRKAHRLTQRDLADRAGVGLRFVREVEAGKQLVVIIEGKGQVVFTSIEGGKAKVEYDLAEQAHVIVYVSEEPEPEEAVLMPAPKRVAKAKQEVTPAAVIKSITITPQSVATGIEDVRRDDRQSP